VADSDIFATPQYVFSIINSLCRRGIWPRYWEWARNSIPA
jgi:hypothetical protein